MSIWYKSLGTLIYDPKAKTIESKLWWLILECDAEIGRYYREMYNLYNRGRDKLMKPAWGTHISILRGEEPPRKELWGTLAGDTIEFEYEDRLLTNDEYCWLDVRCERILDLRETLGLPREPQYNLHITIGRTTS